jgi:hypothetical protein
MLMRGDIFDVTQSSWIARWRGRLLTTGHLSSRHPVVVGRGSVMGVVSVGWSGAGSTPGRSPPTAGWPAPALAACAGAGPHPRAGGQFTVRTSSGGLPLLGSHSLLAGCLLGGYPAERDQWGGKRIVGGVLPRITHTLTLTCGVNRARMLSCSVAAFSKTKYFSEKQISKKKSQCLYRSRAREG